MAICRGPLADERWYGSTATSACANASEHLRVGDVAIDEADALRGGGCAAISSAGSV